MKQERLMKVLLGPLVSEKTTRAAELANQMAFKVSPDATKPEIKQAVEMLFDVKVDDVTVSNVRGKVKRSGQTFGKRKNWKKAYVRLQAGQDINFLGAE